MTETFDRPDLLGQFRQMMHRVGRLVGKLGFGFLVVAALVVALVATTFVGVLLAIAALFLMLTRKRPADKARGGEAAGALEARPTADGWVIESPATRW